MALPFISVVMVEPETPGNIGATARVMANFGFQELILVNPKCNHLSKESYDRASHGKYIIENAKIIYSLNNVFENFDYAIGTTCRVGTDYNILRSPLTPKQLAGKIASISSKANGKKPKIAILFGRESSGLTNNEIKKCDFIVTIPTPKDYPSMNISHAAAIMLYEIYFYSSKQPNTPLNYLPAGSTIEHFNPITRAEKKQIAKMVDEILNKLHFSTKEKKETQRKLWQHIIGKSFMTRREAYALMGFFRKILNYLKYRELKQKQRQKTKQKRKK